MHKNILEIVGNTPLIKINFNKNGELYAKLEYFNPSGSVKDRSALFMIEEAEKNGQLKPGGTIIDASSGNHGVSVAMIGAIKGYKVIITVSEKISKEKLQAIKAYGAEVVICPATSFIDDPNSYHSKARELLKKTPNSFMPNQYFNLSNAKGHYTLLGPEIWKQTNGKITHFFAAIGTGGTISGSGKYLKEKDPKIKIIGFDAQNSYRSTCGKPKPYKLEGIGIDFDTPVVDYTVIDEIIPISDDDAIKMAKKVAVEHGILAGPTSGAVIHGAYCYADKLKNGDLGVIICGDSGRAYLSKNFYE